MGFFNKPWKATKAFVSNPIKIIDNDIQKITNHPKHNQCAAQHLPNAGVNLGMDGAGAVEASINLVKFCRCLKN